MKGRLLLSALGAVVFFGLDSVHVSAGIWTARGADGVPWWYVLVYFAGIFAAADLLRRFERRYQLRDHHHVLAIDIGTFAVLLVLHLVLFRTEVLLALGSIAVLVARLMVVRRPGDLSLGLVIAGLDAAIEWSMASRGLYAYSCARFALLPLWLLPFWAGLGVALRGFFLAAERRLARGPARRAAGAWS